MQADGGWVCWPRQGCVSAGWLFIRATPGTQGRSLGGLPGGGEGGDVVAAVVAAAVDEERRRAGDAAEVSRVDVLGYSAGAPAPGEVVAEPAGVDAGVAGVADQVAHEQGVLVAQQQVIHRPERALVGGGLGGLGSELGVGVDIVE